jgi:hypothetical protein
MEGKGKDRREKRRGEVKKKGKEERRKDKTLGIGGAHIILVVWEAGGWSLRLSCTKSARPDCKSKIKKKKRKKRKGLGHGLSCRSTV